MFDPAPLARLRRLAALVHCFAWEDWRPDGPGHMKSPGGRRLSNAVYERLKGLAPKAGAKADPRAKLQAKVDQVSAELDARYARHGGNVGGRLSAQRKTYALATRAVNLRDKLKALDAPKPAPATPNVAPATPKVARPGLNAYLAQNKPADVAAADWKKLQGAHGVRTAARYYVEHEGKPKGSDWNDDRATFRRQIEWRLRERKLPDALVEPAIALARLEVAHAGLAGGGYDPPEPVRGGRYIGDEEFNRARYLGVHGPLAAGRREYDRLVYDLRDRVKKLAPGTHMDGQSLSGVGDPWEHAGSRFVNVTNGSWYGDSPWKDPAYRTAENLKAEWQKLVEPALAEGRELLAVLKDDRTFSAKTDPEALVKLARGTGNYFVRNLLGKVLERVHNVKFKGKWHSDEVAKIPSWDDVLSGTATLAGIRAARAKEAADDTARRDGYARESVASISAAVKLLDAKAKNSTHWPYLSRVLKAADLGRVEKRQAIDYANRLPGGAARYVEEFWFWPKTGSAVTARSVPELLNKLRTIALSLPAARATAERLDKLTRG